MQPNPSSHLEVVHLASLECVPQPHAIAANATRPTEQPASARATTAQTVHAVARATESSDTWPDPIPLGEPACRAVFPTCVLPPPYRAMVEELSTAMQTPTDFAGMTVLGAISTAVIDQGVLEVKANYFEHTNLFLAVIADSSERKSPVEREAKAPIVEFEKQRQAWVEEHAARARARRQEIRDQIEALSEDLHQGDPEAARRSAALLAEMNAIEVPEQRRLLMDNATPKAVAERMEENGGPAALWSSEGGEMVYWMAGRNGSSQMNVYLQAYAGEPIAMDRAGRSGASVSVPRPALCVCVMMQPTVLPALGTREAQGRGLPARFFHAVPPSLVGYRDVDAPAVRDETLREYSRAIHALMAIAPPAKGHGRDGRHVMQLSEEARKCLRAFDARVEMRMRPDGELFELRSWAGKLVGKVARVAALLRLARAVSEAEAAPWSCLVEEVDMAGAVRLAEEYFIPHARVAFGAMVGQAEVAAAKKLLAVVQRKGMREFTPRVLQQAIGGQGTRKQVVDPGLEVLLAHEYVRRVEAERGVGKSGRPPGERYVVNPKVFAEA